MRLTPFARPGHPDRRSLPELIDLIWDRQIDPGKVFDLTLPLEQAAAGYQAMDERRAIKPCCSHRPVTGWEGRAGVGTGV